ncbi:MAG: HAUS augmin-like complex subunit 4-domain-containing protein [Linnemannia elongata]|nr:MAG: HAUS augmin-like complex subunit 4-domain-containing protein [Linnemannia elongata]
MQDQGLLDRNPGLATLLTDLNTRFLTPTGTSLHLDQDLHQARYALKHKKSYLETKTIFDPIERLRFLPLDNYNNLTGSSSNNAAAADFQRDVSTHLDRLLSILETRRLIIPSSTSQVAERSSRGSSNSNNDSLSAGGPDSTASIISLLAFRTNTHDTDTAMDMDEYVVNQLRPHLDALEGLTPSILTAIQHSIHQRQQELLSLPSLSSNTPATTLTLEDLITRTKKQSLFLDRCKEDSLLLTFTLQNKVQDLFSTLNQTVSTLWEMIVEFQIRYQVEQDQTLKEYFSQLVESLTLKLEILKVTIQEHVYNKQTVAKLATIRQEIDKRQESLMRQRHHNALLLDRYKSAGPEFNSIVQSYTDIMHRIDIVQDDIRRLQ